MTHELKLILKEFERAEKQNIRTVLATVVALDGSSYRRPGVRMLIREDGESVGAVSGGCVEKEVINQSRSVFKNGIAKMMTYDGRYRLGCEGLLYILIEPFKPNKALRIAFTNNLSSRKPIHVICFYSLEVGTNASMGSVLSFDSKRYPLKDNFKINDSMLVFKQQMKPCFKLMIIGAEHDAVQLSAYASLTGWDVTIIASPKEEKSLDYFSGAQELRCINAEQFDENEIDEHTAVMLMTHSYVKDLNYLLKISETKPSYIGILGPAKRREKLLNELIERQPEVSDSFFDKIYGPSGLNVGAETAQEISIAIIAEILAVVRDEKPIMLKDKISPIHAV